MVPFDINWRDIKKGVKPLSELLTITACLSHNNRQKLEIPKKKWSEWVLNDCSHKFWNSALHNYIAVVVVTEN